MDFGYGLNPEIQYSGLSSVSKEIPAEPALDRAVMFLQTNALHGVQCFP